MHRLETTNPPTYEKINELFEQQDLQEKTIQEARDILGDPTRMISISH